MSTVPKGAVAAPRASIGPTPRQRRIGLILTLAGVALALAACVVVGVLLGMITAGGEAVKEMLSATYTERRLFSEAQRSVAGRVAGIPALLLLLSLGAIILGELLRRGVWRTNNTTLWKGGTNSVVFRPLSTRVHLAWIALPVGLWALLILVPLHQAADGRWPASLDHSLEEGVWLILGMYGGLAAGAAVLLSVSLLKKLAYAARVAAGTTVSKANGSRFWRSFTYRWRFDLWLSGVGGAFLGLCWMALHFEDPPFFLATLGIGTACLLVGVITALNFWRAGEPLASGESYS